MRIAAAAALLCAAAGLGGCGTESPPEVRVFAASSLTDVLTRLAPVYEKETGTKVVLNLAASSTLAHQIVQGAPCDLFLSADEEWVEFTRSRRGGIEDGVLLTNRLVVIVAGPPVTNLISSVGSFHIDRSGSIGGTDAIIEVLSAKGDSANFRVRRIAIGDPEHVPAGRYARRGLESLGLWEECRDRLVPCESVRAAVAMVQRGEADAGIVYRTDAATAGLRAVMSLPILMSDERDGPGAAEFPGVEARVVALMIPGEGGGPGNRFLAWLRGPKATAAFRAAGFGIPGEER